MERKKLHFCARHTNPLSCATFFSSPSTRPLQQMLSIIHHSPTRCATFFPSSPDIARSMYHFSLRRFSPTPGALNGRAHVIVAHTRVKHFAVEVESTLFTEKRRELCSNIFAAAAHGEKWTMLSSLLSHVVFYFSFVQRFGDGWIDRLSRVMCDDKLECMAAFLENGNVPLFHFRINKCSFLVLDNIILVIVWHIMCL